MGDNISIATLILVVINLIVVSFSYGKLSQKVSDVNRRVERLESAADIHR